MIFWTISPDWSGETVCLIGGGPSVAGQDLSLLRNRKVIVVNSSYETYPDADILFFGDDRWYREHWQRKPFVSFLGRKVTTAHLTCPDDGITHVKRTHVNDLMQRDAVGVRRTSMTGAMGLAVHLGATKLILLGVDGRRAADGKTHHHSPHPWEPRADSWVEQALDFNEIAVPLAARGIRVWNASPDSAMRIWPVCSLAGALRDASNVS